MGPKKYYVLLLLAVMIAFVLMTTHLPISLNCVSQIQIFIIIIAPFWFPELGTVLALFKIFPHAPPLKYNLFSCFSFVSDASIFFHLLIFLIRRMIKWRKKVKKKKDF